jgi:hypothetical protein
MVYSELPISVLFYGEAVRICSPCPTALSAASPRELSIATVRLQTQKQEFNNG